jgi:hypothetical protein
MRIAYTYMMGTILFLGATTGCEKVIEVDLNTADPAFVAEAVFYKDSVCMVTLTETTSYFGAGNPGIIEDATIYLHESSQSERLYYRGNGTYRGTIITGTEGVAYELEILHGGTTYRAHSRMPKKAEMFAVGYSKSNDQSIMNPFGETVFTIGIAFVDDPEEESYYMVRFLEEGKMIEKNYFMLTEDGSVGGSFEKRNDTIAFGESIFYEGGEVDVELLSLDAETYNYFLQLNDILFWKRRVMPPTPYNPDSNWDNGALGYFAAWTIDSERLLLE